ncbi:hypothetical protein ACFWEF_20325, partial [Bacillus velezensis]
MDDQNKNEKIDNKIIEHLACLEINSLILKPPFRLVGNIQVDDKGISYDGEIQVYNNTKLIKSNVAGEVRVQVKGTTTYKKIHKLNKIKHRVEKKDIEVYNKFGVGVLYLSRGACGEPDHGVGVEGVGAGGEVEVDGVAVYVDEPGSGLRFAARQYG